jgi:hypothetical protein
MSIIQTKARFWLILTFIVVVAALAWGLAELVFAHRPWPIGIVTFGIVVWILMFFFVPIPRSGRATIPRLAIKPREDIPHLSSPALDAFIHRLKTLQPSDWEALIRAAHREGRTLWSMWKENRAALALWQRPSNGGDSQAGPSQAAEAIRRIDALVEEGVIPDDPVVHIEARNAAIAISSRDSLSASEFRQLYGLFMEKIPVHEIQAHG